MIIYRLTDRIPVKIGELTFWLAPLSASQKSELLSLVTMKSGEERVNPMALASRAVAMSLKKIEGLVTSDGEPYSLRFDPSGNVEEECVQEILSLDGADLLILTVKEFAFNQVRVPKNSDNNDLEGVSIDFSNVDTLKKRQKAESQAS